MGQHIAMDQLYVAFYPNECKYLSLFGSGGDRIVDVDDKIRQQRIDIRKQILTKIRNGDIDKAALSKKSWVNVDILKEKEFDLSLAELNAVDTSGVDGIV